MTERDELVARIMRAQHELQRVFAYDRSNPLLGVNLTMTQLKIVMILSLRGGATGHELSEAMGVSPATITGIIARLTAQNLVARHEDPTDRRIRRIALTTAGRQLIDGLVSAGADHQARLLQRLSLADLSTVERALTLILGAAAAEAAEAG